MMRTIAALAFLPLLGACGQSGDLYLPSESAPAPAETSASPVVPGPAAATPDETEKEKNPEVERTP